MEHPTHRPRRDSTPETARYLAVGHDPATGDLADQLDRAGDGGDRVGVVGIDAPGECREGHGAIHRSRVEKSKAKATSQLPRHATFARSCRPIDGYDHKVASGE